ncbi:MAG: gamma-glutamylcyclotransferase [Paracoccus sp. (in: a-proteobacteria)]|uniref:gamma-glutamylcyclotransferase n=1 Tax=Paracoccus sp. TaxID=267 RepID=UPI0026DEF3AB|nr:gamma-glutamylcyclotransferase [Paracoccus sp. (in: a-proteobacteria)]MDO5621113.1 gamma-glutamylcyclotransferase [Paracoccus sp. (in: a-proteobacteria)]
MSEHWVFGYGSLIWHPEFPVAEQVNARLDGYARRFCMHSVEYRGTPERPGLVLALDRAEAASCAGVAFRIDPADWPQAIAGLRARELVTNAYAEAELLITLADRRQVTAITYVIRHDHHQYTGDLSLSEQARIIAAAHGQRGPNRDYLFNTALHLAELGLPDPALEELSQMVRDLIAPPAAG